MAKLAKNFKKTWIQDGIKVKADIDPCSWMYGDKLSITIFALGQSEQRISRKNFENCAARDFLALIKKPLKIRACSRCGKPRLDVKGSNRGTLCEKCFVSDLNRELQLGLAQEKKRMARIDAKNKAAGRRFVVTAWVHPVRGGDYQVNLYFRKRPTDATIKANLRSMKSQVLDDFGKIRSL